MMEIDGSFGEGGGQIVRTAAALSAVTGTPVGIRNIRMGRPKPGLAPQHAQALLALARLCNAQTEGVSPGSSRIAFHPGKVKGGTYRAEIGTAGSVTLLMQCLLPAMLTAEDPVSLEVHGGTDVQWSPSIDYFRYVFLPALRCFGARARMELRQRGYYPRGQGSVLLRTEPSLLRAAQLSARDGTKDIEGISHCSNLPEHVARRQAESASKLLREAGLASNIRHEILKAPSTGSGITLWSGFKGGSALGARGLPAEEVGEKAAEELALEMRSAAAVDVHLCDQLIPYLAMAGGSYTVREISMHTRTNILTAGHFFKRKISISGEDVFQIEAV
jgi:RNA 3'-terminal phosphate cyclase (ATP)